MQQTGLLPAPIPPGSAATARELIDRRYSCRTYLPEPMGGGQRALLLEYLAAASVGPFGSQARFGLLDASPEDAGALRRLGTYGFIKGATGFLAGAVAKGPQDLEDYGYLLEHVILYATGLGLGTCWLGGTFTRSSFERRFGGLRRGESMPAVVSVGRIGDDGSERIRAREQGDRRLPWAELFYEGGFGRPLGSTEAGVWAEPLEAVRMAPSATNRQPWRMVYERGVGAGDGANEGSGTWHFYLRRFRGYGKGSRRARVLFAVARIADLQRVDLGIAMSHFELTARERGLSGAWVVSDPGLPLPADTEYGASWVCRPGRPRSRLLAG